MTAAGATAWVGRGSHYTGDKPGDPRCPAELSAACVGLAESLPPPSLHPADPCPLCPQLYELDGDPKRKEFLDDLFSFMQKRGEHLPGQSSHGGVLPKLCDPGRLSLPQDGTG